MILYGIATETSIGRLFLAGVVPGLLLVCCSRSTRGAVDAARRGANWRRRSTTALHVGAEDRGLGRVAPFIGIVDRDRLCDVRRLATPSEVAALVGRAGAGAGDRDLPRLAAGRSVAHLPRNGARVDDDPDDHRAARCSPT
jgi:hypothetical protein